ncbi:hypothetical protein ACTGVA_11810, partial [Streptococcus suis]
MARGDVGGAGGSAPALRPRIPRLRPRRHAWARLGHGPGAPGIERARSSGRTDPSRAAVLAAVEPALGP